MRSVQTAVVLHVDDCAVIGAKRLADIKRSRTLGADQYPVASSSSVHLPAQTVAFDLDVYAIDDKSCSGWASSYLDRRLALQTHRAQRHQFDCHDSPFLSMGLVHVVRPHAGFRLGEPASRRSGV